MSTIKSYISNHKKDIIYCVIILIFSIVLFNTIKQCSSWKQTNSNNIEAFTDTIKYYKDKHGDLVASKTLIECEFNDLKKINEELYNEIKSMNATNKPQQVIHTENVIVNELHDTIIEIKDSVANFEFTNPYRTLCGTIHTSSDSLGLSITKDEVYFDYNIVIKDNNVWLKSTNPYIKYNEVTGITIPQSKTKQKRFGIGPAIGVGYDLKSGVVASVGVAVTYHLWEW